MNNHETPKGKTKAKSEERSDFARHAIYFLNYPDTYQNI